jgi:hypothetical protein
MDDVKFTGGATFALIHDRKFDTNVFTIDFNSVISAKEFHLMSPVTSSKI